VPHAVVHIITASSSFSEEHRLNEPAVWSIGVVHIPQHT